ncbi:hypothetical protein CWB96_20835, partial [Pseudoalteromonas citrea]
FISVIFCFFISDYTIDYRLGLFCFNEISTLNQVQGDEMGLIYLPTSSLYMYGIKPRQRER